MIAVLSVVGWRLWTPVPHASVWTPVVRFVDPPSRAGQDPGPAARGVGARRGAIGDRTRYVLPLRQDGLDATFESADVVVPKSAELAFTLGATFGSETDHVVTFEIRACQAAACDAVFSERVDFATAAAPEGWLERRVTLTQLAGTTRRFVFHARATSPATQVLWANPTLRAAVPRDAAARNNVILVSLDTLRADRLTSYGYAHDTAPFIDATFARGGTVFEHCVAAATTTTASHMTMFTALPPSVHEVGLANIQRLAPWISTLPELLRAEGFSTGAITEDGWVTFGQGFGRGFDTYLENKGPNIAKPKGQADVTFREAEAWLRRHRDERFFLFLHTYQVHSPYVPPPEYAPLFADQPGTPPHMGPEAANYDREIRFTDDMLRTMFTTMAELGLDDETVVVLTSDHGEEFGEHGCVQHGEQLYEEVTRVPLMIWGPGVPAGRRVAEPVGLIDIMPTVLDLAGVDPPAAAMGVSLVPALTSGHAPADRHLFTESWAQDVCPGKTFERPGFVVRTGHSKLARYRRDGAFVYERYDLATDRLERTNRYDPQAGDAAALRALVDRYQEDCRLRAKMLQTSKRASGPAKDSVPLDDRQREKLRALGYVE